MSVADSLPSAPPIYSEFRDDPDFQELLALFVGEMPTRQQGLQGAFVRRDFDNLRTFAHQLKGAGGSYGFHELSELAAALELACKQHDEVELTMRLEQTVEHLARVSL